MCQCVTVLGMGEAHVTGQSRTCPAPRAQRPFAPQAGPGRGLVGRRRGLPKPSHATAARARGAALAGTQPASRPDEQIRPWITCRCRSRAQRLLAFLPEKRPPLGGSRRLRRRWPGTPRAAWHAPGCWPTASSLHPRGSAQRLGDVPQALPPMSVAQAAWSSAAQRQSEGSSRIGELRKAPEGRAGVR